MNKQELLNDLLAKNFIANVGTPALAETKPDGTKIYITNVREEVQDKATYRNIAFYVVDEGEATEQAFYKDSTPKAGIISTEFRDFVWANFRNVNPNIVYYTWNKIDEDVESGVINGMVEDVNVSGEFTVKAFSVSRENAELVIRPFSLPPENILK